MSVRAPIEPPQAGGYQPGPPGPSKGGGGGLGPVVLILLALAAAVAIVATAVILTRGDSAEDEVPLGAPVTTAQVAPPTAPTVPTTVDPEAAAKAEVIAAYRAAWDDFLAVGRDPKATADDDRLRAHATGTSLVVQQKATLERKANNEIFDGEVKLLDPKVVELSPSVASVSDCVEDSTGTVNAVTGARVKPATRGVFRATVTMKKIGDTWKQSNYTSVDASCAGS